MKANNITVKETVKTKKIEAELYVGLPNASTDKYGIVKIDGKTIKLNEHGQLKAIAEVDNSQINDDLAEHINDMDLHLSSIQKEMINDTVPTHINDTNIHLTKEEKDKLIISLDEAKKKVDEIEENIQIIVSEITDDMTDTLNDHIGDSSIHFPKSDIDHEIGILDEKISKHINDSSEHLSISEISGFLPNKNTSFRYIKDTVYGLGGNVSWLQCQVFKNFRNIAKGAFATCNIDGVNASQYTNGIIKKENKITANNVESGYIIVDLGYIAQDVDYLRIFHDLDASSSYNHKIEVSADASEWITIYDSGVNGLYKESAYGKIHILNYNALSTALIEKEDVENGSVLFYDKKSYTRMEPGFILNTGSFVGTSEELERTKIKRTDFSEVFSSWKRFSHLSGHNQPASMDELNSWTYDKANNRVICGINSTTVIGFVSEKKYDTYVHEATLKSTDGDDDQIGVVIAFAVDENGVEHTLSAVRQRQNRPAWRLVYDHQSFGGASGEWNIASMVRVGAENVPDNGSAGGWSAIPNGTRVRIEREKDIIKAYCSMFNSTDIEPGSLLQIDLSSDPRLEIFRGKCSYGYSANSQKSSTYENIFFTSADSDTVIYDTRTGEAWIYTGNRWIIDTSRTLTSDFGYGKLLYDESNRNLFFVEYNGKCKKIKTKYEQEVLISRPDASQIHVGYCFFDVTINKPIWWSGDRWVDANGTTA